MKDSSRTSEILESYNITYTVSYRKVKHPRLEFTTGQLLLILPPGHDPDAIMKKHEKWIHRKIDFIEECVKKSSKKKIVQRSDPELRTLVHRLAERFSQELSVNVNQIFLRKMGTKWASCSPRRNLTINRLMRYLPENLIDYVIFHEVAHLIEKKHDDKFWKIVERKFPSHQDIERDLFVYWFRLARNRDSPVTTTYG